MAHILYTHSCLKMDDEIEMVNYPCTTGYLLLLLLLLLIKFSPLVFLGC